MVIFKGYGKLSKKMAGDSCFITRKPFPFKSISNSD